MKNSVGTFSVQLEVGNPSREEFVAVEALVDTGAIYNMLPEDLLDRLGSPEAGNRHISNSPTIASSNTGSGMQWSDCREECGQCPWSSPAPTTPHCSGR